MLGVPHKMSSPYHPESQKVLERFHQSLKSMLKKFCIDRGKEWDEGVLLVLFVTCDAVQESLGFSPAELIFGHSMSGPLKVLKETFMSNMSETCKNALDYTSAFREHWHRVCNFARKILGKSQARMKRCFDKKCSIS